MMESEVSTLKVAVTGLVIIAGSLWLWLLMTMQYINELLRRVDRLEEQLLDELEEEECTP